VIHWLPHPIKVRKPRALSWSYIGARPVYLICLSHKPNMCLGEDERVSAETILVAVDTAVDLAALIWAIYTNRQGRETPQDKGTNKKSGGKHRKGRHFNQCLGGTDSTSSRVYFTTNCFGNDYTSWIPQTQNPPATQYRIFNYSSALADHGLTDMIATRNTRQGAYVYNRDRVRGEWYTWSYYKAGYCNPC